MEMTVVRVVMRMGLIRMAPASTSASISGTLTSIWFTVSTYRMPLLTTVPTSIRKPSMDTMLMGLPVRYRRPKEPIRLKGMVTMTIREYLGDSNCMPITMNIRNTPVTRAPPRVPSSSPIISSMLLVAGLTFSGSFHSFTNAFTSFSAVFLYSAWGCMVMATWYCLSFRSICCGLS